MKIFKDLQMNNEISSIDFGNVSLHSDGSQNFVLYNENNSVLTVKLSSNSDKISLSHTFVTLKKGEKVSINISWRPSLSLKESLKSIVNIMGEEIFE